MKKLLFYLFMWSYSIIANAQQTSITEWINSNALVIEDANPDTRPIAFSKAVPENFKNARIFGFGEASHHGKEFFDLKAKFFKYLVENQGVKIFIMEESYQAEKGINQWISGGEGDVSTILNNFNQGPWYCREVRELLQWMRDYNIDKAAADQIRFYGMDNQFGKDLNIRLRKYLEKYNIEIDENLLAAADSCSAAQIKRGGIKGFADTHLPKLQQIKLILKQNDTQLSAADKNEYTDMLRAMDYLEQFTLFAQNPQSNHRDIDMYNNVLWIMEHQGPDAKAFIWAHNEHVNKKFLWTNGGISVGSKLKGHFKNDYYCVGFDFGKGVVPGFKNGKNPRWNRHTLDKPFKKTFASTLITAQPDIYFIDMATAIASEPAANFFGTNHKQLGLGGNGFDPKNYYLFKRKYTETFDGLIFVKTISPATYKR